MLDRRSRWWTAAAAVLFLALGGAASARAAQRGTAPAPGAAAGDGVTGAASPPASFFWPGAIYDPAIPPMRDVLGHEPSDGIVSPAEALRYLQALAAAAPRRMKIVEYGRTWEDRPLVYAVIASEQNFARLDAIQRGMASLADPRRTDGSEADALIKDLPAVVWLGYGIHGDEISSTDAAVLVAYHLLAARDDELVRTGLQSAVVVIDPSLNPDGRNRFVESNRAAVGSTPSSSPVAAERDQPWPGGRTNHYFFDLNRDLIALTQPESRARVRALLDWYPLVVVDAHEMGAESTYFFPPNSDPANPHITPTQQQALELFGRNNARWFDRFGFRYFTREVFDFFYPGYADTWATFQGGIGMTYEEASARGLVVRRPDGTLLTYRDGVRQHFVASLATIETAATNRERLLRDFWTYRSSAIDEGRHGKVREQVLPWRGDTSRVDELAGVLIDQGLEVRRSTRAISACGQELPVGSIFVSMAQPAGRFASTLLEPGADMQEKFLREQERRRRKSLPNEMYDITAWSLPLLYGVERITCGEEVAAAALEPVTRAAAESARVAPAHDAGIAMRGAGLVTGGVTAPSGDSGPAVAFLVPWGTSAAGRFLIAALERGVDVLGADAAITLGGRKYPRGTLVVRAPSVDRGPASDRDPAAPSTSAAGTSVATGPTREAFAATIAELAKATGAEVIATSTTWVDEGVSFGSDRVVKLRRPSVALAWDEPTSGNAAGATRWVLERRLGVAVTAVRTSRLASADLDEFDVVILPDGDGYARVLGDQGAQSLERFVDRGGVLIALAGAVEYLASPGVSLLSTREETRASAPQADETASSQSSSGASTKKGAGAASETKKPTPTTADAAASSNDEEAPKSPASSAAPPSTTATPTPQPKGSAKPAAGASSDRAAGKVLTSEKEYLASIEAESAPPDVVPGVLVRAAPDPDHWLTVGVPPIVTVMAEGSAIFSPLRLDQGTNALHFVGADDLVASGYLWKENRAQLAWKPFVLVEQRGRGYVIGFTADPTFRGVLAGMDVLLLDAVVRAPAHVQR